MRLKASVKHYDHGTYTSELALLIELIGRLECLHEGSRPICSVEVEDIELVHLQRLEGLCEVLAQVLTRTKSD